MTKNRPAPVPYAQPYRYPSPHIPMAAIRRFARQIAERFHPDKIILFGSYAYGQPHEESDVDLLVIMPARDVVNQEIRIGLAFERPFSHDIVVRTPKQVERGLKQNNWFLREVIDKGKVLYDAGNNPVGAIRRGGSARGKRHGGPEKVSGTVLKTVADTWSFSGVGGVTSRVFPQHCLSRRHMAFQDLRQDEVTTDTKIVPTSRIVGEVIGGQRRRSSRNTVGMSRAPWMTSRTRMPSSMGR
jgi:predicted nucleotidyltransferase